MIQSVTLNTLPALAKEGIDQFTLQYSMLRGVIEQQTWFFNSKVLKNSSHYLMQETSLVILGLNRNDTGLYSVRLTNPFSNVTAQKEVIVFCKISFYALKLNISLCFSITYSLTTFFFFCRRTRWADFKGNPRKIVLCSWRLCEPVVSVWGNPPAHCWVDLQWSEALWGFQQSPRSKKRADQPGRSLYVLSAQSHDQWKAGKECHFKYLWYGISSVLLSIFVCIECHTLTTHSYHFF